MAHHNTLLGQMLQMFPRHEFQSAVLKIGTEYHSRGFSSWNHFVAMLFGQLVGIDNLRGIQASLPRNQNNQAVLKVRSFLGASRNALLSQL